jgi:hypothetical protein
VFKLDRFSSTPFHSPIHETYLLLCRLIEGNWSNISSNSRKELEGLICHLNPTNDWRKTKVKGTTKMEMKLGLGRKKPLNDLKLVLLSFPNEMRNQTTLL